MTKLIVQFPYVIKAEHRKKIVEEAKRSWKEDGLLVLDGMLKVIAVKDNIELEFADVVEEPAEEMKVIGYNNHDCETWYACPYCNVQYCSWQLHNAGLNPGDTFNCEKCGKKLKVNK
jgi:hypothetical protein